MEQKLVKVPFEVDLAKRIQNNEVKGRIVTRGGKNARVICWDAHRDDNIIALIEDENGVEFPKSYDSDGMVFLTCESKCDLMLEIPEYLAFKDGDIVACGWEEHNESSSWISIIKSVNTSADGVRTSDYVILITKSNNNTDGVIKYDSYTTSGEWIRKATEEEKQKLIDALKENKEPKAKEYLKRFFNIEVKPKCEFKPFDKVIVRDGDRDKWEADFFSHKIEDNSFPYICVSDSHKYCIPYNDQTKHLLGTKDNWEE